MGISSIFFNFPVPSIDWGIGWSLSFLLCAFSYALRSVLCAAQSVLSVLLSIEGAVGLLPAVPTVLVHQVVPDRPVHPWINND